MNTNDNRLKAHKLIDHIFQDLLPAHGMAQRPEQIQLSHRMLDAMQDGRIALCDAGTGIGKTYAYLAAATAASAFPTGQIARPTVLDAVKLFTSSQTDMIFYTAEDVSTGGAMLCAAAGDITQRIKKILWQPDQAFVLTSGTMAVGSDFRRFKTQP